MSPPSMQHNEVTPKPNEEKLLVALTLLLRHVRSLLNLRLSGRRSIVALMSPMLKQLLVTVLAFIVTVDSQD